MNNKGFTLVELIAVLAVMITILLIAIPSISSSIERNKGSLDKQNEKIIHTAAESYSELYLNTNLERWFKVDGSCGIYIDDLIKNNLIDEETTIKNDGSSVKEMCVWYDKNDNTYNIDSCFVGDNDGRCGVE